MKKNITLYIQGVNYLSSNLTLFQWLINFGYWIIHAKPNYKTSHPDWLTKKNFHSEKIISVAWKADLNPLSKRQAVQELKKVIYKYKKEYNIIIVGTSLGGLIALDALSDIKIQSVSNLILVGSINNKKSIYLKDVKILNIFSSKDTLAKLAIQALFPFRGSQELFGPLVTNIHIAGIRHDQMFKNHRITSGIYKNKKIGQAIFSEIKDIT